MTVSRYVKAIAALLGALGTWGLTATATAADGAGAEISNGEWFGLCMVLGTALGVFALPNTPPPNKPADPNMSETDPTARWTEGYQIGLGQTPAPPLYATVTEIPGTVEPNYDPPDPHALH